MYLIAILLCVVVLYFLLRSRAPKKLEGQRVLITGAGSGIGNRLAHYFAKEGTRLVLWDLRDNLLESTKKELAEAFPKIEVSTYVCDVSNRHMVASVAAEVKKNDGKVDILVNNAGIVFGKTLLELTDEQVQRTMDVNAMAHFWTLKAFLPDMMKENNGHIVTIASCMALAGACGLSDYCASKFAAFGLHESVRLEIRAAKKFGVDTLIVCPFAIKTGMFEGLGVFQEWILPLLETDYVVQQIVNSVKNRTTMLVMPKAVQWIAYLARLMRPEWSDAFTEKLGATSAMNSFKGRGAEWSLKKLDDAKTPPQQQ